MSFFITDPSESLRKNLEKLLGIKGFLVGEKLDTSIRSVVSNPQLYVVAAKMKENFNNINDYMKMLSGIRTSFIPIIFYSESSEKDINDIGLLKGTHYDEYFSKLEKNSIERVAGYMKSKLDAGNLKLDGRN